MTLSLASFPLGQKVVLPLVLYQDMAHPQCCSWVPGYLRNSTLDEMLHWSTLSWWLLAKWKWKYPREGFLLFLFQRRRYIPLVLVVLCFWPEQVQISRSLCKNHGSAHSGVCLCLGKWSLPLQFSRKYLGCHKFKRQIIKLSCIHEYKKAQKQKAKYWVSYWIAH